MTKVETLFFCFYNFLVFIVNVFVTDVTVRKSHTFRHTPKKPKSPLTIQCYTLFFTWINDKLGIYHQAIVHWSLAGHLYSSIFCTAITLSQLHLFMVRLHNLARGDVKTFQWIVIIHGR